MHTTVLPRRPDSPGNFHTDTSWRHLKVARHILIVIGAVNCRRSFRARFATNRRYASRYAPHAVRARTQTKRRAARLFFDSANFAVVAFTRITAHKRNLCRTIWLPRYKLDADTRTRTTRRGHISRGWFGSSAVGLDFLVSALLTLARLFRSTRHLPLRCLRASIFLSWNP